MDTIILLLKAILRTYFHIHHFRLEGIVLQISFIILYYTYFPKHLFIMLYFILFTAPMYRKYIVI